MARKKIQAVAYLRTSVRRPMSAPTRTATSASARRSRPTPRQAGIEIVETYYDEAVCGADTIETRPGFSAMLERLLSNGVRTIVVETANRFARDLIVQETGYAMLKERGIELIAADKPDAFLDDTPTATLIRQILGAVSQFEKAMLVVEAARRPRAQAGDRRQGRGPQVPRRDAPRSRGAGQAAAPRSRCRCARSRPSCSPPATPARAASRSRRSRSPTCWHRGAKQGSVG